MSAESPESFSSYLFTSNSKDLLLDIISAILLIFITKIADWICVDSSLLISGYKWFFYQVDFSVQKKLSIKSLMNKWTNGITWRDKNLLHLPEKFKHKYTNDENLWKVNNHYHYTGKYKI